MALTKNRNTASREGLTLAAAVVADVQIFAGALVALTAAGLATPGATATGLAGAGRAKFAADNTGGNDGDETVEIEKGVFRYDNSTGADEITAADIGADGFIVDDETVAKTDGSSSRSVAGKVFDVDASGVWIKFD